MPQCIKCKLYHYTDKPFCNQCIKDANENGVKLRLPKTYKTKEEDKIKCNSCKKLVVPDKYWKEGKICRNCKAKLEDRLCGRCGKVVLRFKRNKLCAECVDKQKKFEDNWNKALESLDEVISEL